MYMHYRMKVIISTLALHPFNKSPTISSALAVQTDLLLFTPHRNPLLLHATLHLHSILIPVFDTEPSFATVAVFLAILPPP